MVFLTLVMTGLVIFLTTLAAQGQVGSGMPPNEHGLVPVVVDGIEFSDETPTEGDEIIISATISNNVSMRLTNITVVFRVEDVEIGNNSGIALDVNGSKVVDQVWKTKVNMHIISVMISMEGKPLTGSQLSKEIVVEPDPIGNFITPMILLFMIFLLISVTTIFPGIVELIRGNGKN